MGPLSILLEFTLWTIKELFCYDWSRLTFLAFLVMSSSDASVRVHLNSSSFRMLSVPAYLHGETRSSRNLPSFLLVAHLSLHQVSIGRGCSSLNRNAHYAVQGT